MWLKPFTPQTDFRQLKLTAIEEENQILSVYILFVHLPITP
jgi:hypothetical protein